MPRWDETFVRGFEQGSENAQEGAKLMMLQKMKEQEQAQKKVDWGRVVSGIGQGMAGFAAPFLGNFNWKPNTDLTDAESTLQNKLMFEMMKNTFQQEQAQIRYDASLGAKGFQRMSEAEAKQHLFNLRKSGYSVQNGFAFLPAGATFEDGYIYNKKGDTIGEYAKGYEPQTAVIKHTNDVLQVGRTFYKFNPELAKRVGKTGGATDIDFSDIATELKEMYPESQGNFIPSTIRIGNRTYRYIPTIEEQLPIGGMGSPQQTTPQGLNTPKKYIRTGTDEQGRRVGMLPDGTIEVLSGK